MRREVFPCRAMEAWISSMVNADCRRCHSWKETIGHISSDCTYMDSYRVKCHNVLCDVVEQKVKEKGWTVCREPYLRDPIDGSIKHPDFVLIKGEGFILDPCITYERDRESLIRANQIKEDKYQSLCETVKNKFQVKTVFVRGLAVGARGG